MYKCILNSAFGIVLIFQYPECCLFHSIVILCINLNK